MRNPPSLKLRLTPLLFIFTLLRSASFSTANVSDPWLSSDAAGQQRTTTFSQDASAIYARAEVRNAPEGTRIRAVWYAIEAENVAVNFKIDETTVTTAQLGNTTAAFTLTNSGFWPRGRYNKLETYLNDEAEPTRALEFQTQ